MNQQVLKLFTQACYHGDYEPENVPNGVVEKFAELIVRECINVSKQHARALESQPCDPDFQLYEEGIVCGIGEATAAIERHFGIPPSD